MPASPLSAETSRRAGVAGLCYLTVVVTGFFAILYVPSQLIVMSDPAATVHNIERSRLLFQLGIVAGIVCQVAFIALPLALYRLLSHVHREAAVLMVVLALVSVPISLLNLAHKVDIVTLLGTAQALRALAPADVQGQVMQSLRSFQSGALIAEVFWGLWLAPFGFLAYRSGFIPRLLGVCLMLGCAGYLIGVTGTLLVEGYDSSAVASVVSLPSAVGEIGTCVWLLVAGARGGRGR